MSQRRLRQAAAFAIGGALCVGIVLWFVYPMVGRWIIRSRVLPNLTARVGVEVVVDDIELERGRATLRGLGVGRSDGESSLVEVERIVVDYNFWRSLIFEVAIGEVRVRGLEVDLNYADSRIDSIVARVKSKKSSAAPISADESRDSKTLPASIVIESGSARVVAPHVGAQVRVDGLTGTLGRDGSVALVLADVALRSNLTPPATAASVHIQTHVRSPFAKADAVLKGGAVELWPGMELSSIAGTVAPRAGAEKLHIDLRGSYGSAKEELWSAKGWINALSREASLEVVARDLELVRLKSVLDGTGIVDPEDTRVAASFRADVAGSVASFSGTAKVEKLSFFHPKVAEKTIEDVSAEAGIEGTLSLPDRTLELKSGTFRLGDVDYAVSGFVQAGDKSLTETDPAFHARLSIQFSVEEATCQQVLQSLPVAFVPYFQGIELRGQFSAGVLLAIDWADLDSTRLEGNVGIGGCRVVVAPDDRAVERLKETFEHWVEVDGGQWVSFLVGPENPDFAPLDQISHHLVNAIMTTEDSRFYQHKGYIPREFRSALIKDLKAGYFRYGASSITMQTVKNVILYREKTLSRKFQELFFTWYLESEIEKDRIMEIYLNAIEYGPGLYGIGPAAREYFGKHPRDLTPLEAAFFSSILPNPKKRYEQFCDGQLTRWTKGKLQRVLKLMHDRDRLEESEYMLAAVSPLDFVIRDDVSPRECKDRVKTFIEQRGSESQNPRKR